jgi:hypothetical protein
VIAQSVQCWAMEWMIGVLGLYSWQGLGIFLHTTVFRMALRPTQPSIQWVLGALSLGVKWPRSEADHSPPSTAEVKNMWHYTSIPQYTFMAWYLLKHRDNFTFTLLQRSLRKFTFSPTELNCPPCFVQNTVIVCLPASVGPKDNIQR